MMTALEEKVTLITGADQGSRPWHCGESISELDPLAVDAIFLSARRRGN